eukprot:11197847-Lingulodinium_polyedra.AAC.1
MQGQPGFQITWHSRCQVPVQIYLVHDALQTAIDEAEGLLAALRREMGQMLGVAGARPENLQLQADSATCWNWCALVHRVPTADAVAAFGRARAELG